MKRLALAFIFAFGYSVPVWADFLSGVAAYNRGDYATALSEIEPLAEQGHVHAQYQLGRMYELGLGVSQNHAEAAKWYRLAAEQGDWPAAANLAWIYYSGEGVPQDYAEAVKWLLRAAEQGNAGVQAGLGWIYEKGDGVPQNYAEALKWYRLAAEQGLARAQNNLGFMYGTGKGVPLDYAKAMRWYRKSAEQGNAMAQNNLGIFYREGRSVPLDYVAASKWYRKAAEQGHAGAQRNLGFMYGQGQGIPQDYVQTHKWFNLAASRLPPGKDRDLAVENRDIAAEKMTAAQIAEAQRLAREWRPKTQRAKAAENNSRLPRVRKLRPDEALARGETVKSIQTDLAVLGYKPGPADGIVGPRTRSVIKAFQRDQGVLVTGEASLSLQALLSLERMNRETANRNPTTVEPSD